MCSCVHMRMIDNLNRSFNNVLMHGLRLTNDLILCYVSGLNEYGLNEYISGLNEYVKRIGSSILLKY